MKNTSVKKKKGPIRTEAIALIILVGVIVGVYGKFFLDTHLRYILKKELTKVNCAEVNIDFVKTNFFEGSLAIGGVEFTNYDAPDFNVLEIQELSVEFNWDALLRSRFVSPISKILGLNFNQKRKSRGEIYPDLKEIINQKVGAKEKIQSEADKLKDENVFANLIDFIKQDGGIGERLKALKVDFSADEYVENTKNLLSQKKENWKDEITKLKKAEELKSLVEQAKSIKISKDPVTLLGQIKEVQGLKDQAKKKVEEYKKSINDVRSDFNGMKQKIKGVEEVIKADIAQIKKEMSLPSLEFSGVTQNIFKGYIDRITGPYIQYVKTYQSKIPTKKKEFEAPKVERLSGADYYFEQSIIYPKYWVKKVEISGETKVSKSNQKTELVIEGDVQNISSHPEHVLTFNLLGRRPESKVQGMKISGEVHKKNGLEVLANGDISSYPLSDLRLFKDKKINLLIEQAIAKTDIDFSYSANSLKFQVNTLFDQVKWFFESQKEKVDKRILSILNKIPEVDLRIFIGGSLDKIRPRISSNFDQQFKNALSALFKEKLKEGEQKIRELVEKEVSEGKLKLQKLLGDSEGDVLQPLLKAENSLEGIEGAFSEVLKKMKSKQEDKLKSKVKDELDKLKGKIKLPF
jgi:uncharacterized protein (TIGR03545 family)